MSRNEEDKYVIVVEFEIYRPDYPAFLTHVKENARTSLEQEEGCLTFEVLESIEAKNTVLLYEVYSDRNAFTVHLEQDHYKEFSQTVERMVKSKAVRSYSMAA